MCGICGFFGRPPQDPAALLQTLLESIRHRGPDDAGVWCAHEKRVGLGHRRLAIIDLSPTGKQPMLSASGRYVTVFNGEIYNFKELRAELLAFDYQFRGTSDTEVMLAAFEQWGIHEATKRLNGMFAVAVYDQQEDELNLFRDRIGVKPLYYRWHNQALFFSSELTLPFSRIGDRIIDRDSLALYFRLNYIPAPYTIYKDIYKLLPGHIAKVTRTSVRSSCFASMNVYWNTQERINEILSDRDNSICMDEAVDMVDAALRRSISQRMISDVPLGAFLSGGIDSSLVVAHMQALSTTPVKTFTIGFNEDSSNEAHHAKRIAEYLGTEHTELIVTESDALEVIPSLPGMYGEPFADSSQIPTYMVSKLTRQSITVALSGDGGDELFAGYGNYLGLVKVQRFLSLLPPSLYVATSHLVHFHTVQQILRAYFGEQRYEWIFKLIRLLSQDKENRIPRGVHSAFSLPERMVLGSFPGASVIPFYRCHGNVTEQMMCDDLMVYHPDDILTKVDRASMAVSLEVRVPFIDDYEFFETAWKIPFHHKANWSGGKILLKNALSRHIPTSLFDRPKMGFGIPLARWLNGPLKEWVNSCIDPFRIKREEYLDPAMISHLTTKRAEENDWYAYKLWAVCIFQAWLEDIHCSA
jgi:asparagine synthase (glutamine-hydrolysing)